MTIFRHTLWISFFVILCGLLLPAIVSSEDSQKIPGKSGENTPIVIKSDTLEIDNKRKIITFSGNVEAQESDFVMNCQKMFLYYAEQPTKKTSDNPGLKMDKIVATGKVKISRAEGGEATAEQAVYYQSDERVVLTGKPIVKQGNDFVEGDKITLFLKENRSIVEGSSERKVRAILFPDRKKGNVFDR